jgi:hypothetical protein
LVGGDLREINPCVLMWFASLSWFLAYLIGFRFDLLRCAICLCRGHYLACVHLQGHSPILVCVRSQDELEVVFVGSLWRTGRTGAGQRSDQWLLWSRASDRSAPPVWPSFRGRKVKVDRLTYSSPSRRHQSTFTPNSASYFGLCFFLCVCYFDNQ